MHQPQEALSDIEKTIDLTPEDETAYLLRGRIYEELSNPEVAEQNYQQVIELNPFNEEAYLLAGSLLIGQKKSTMKRLSSLMKRLKSNRIFQKYIVKEEKPETLKVIKKVHWKI